MNQRKTITVRFAPPEGVLPYTSYLRNGSVITAGITLEAYHSLARDEGIVEVRAINSKGRPASGDLQLPARAMDELAAAWLRYRHNSPGEVAAFADDGSECPGCGSWDIAGDDVSTNAGEATQEMSCNRCGATWVHVYASIGHSDLVQGEGNAVE